MLRYVLAWFPMVIIAVANGVLRERWLVRYFSELQARQISTLLLLALFAAYIALIVRLWPLASSRQAIAVGLVWLCLTLVFEFALGRLVSGLSWSAMLEEYNLAAGRLWALVPLWVAVAPYVFHRLYQ